MIKHFRAMVYALMVINILLNIFFTIMVMFKASEYNIFNIVTGCMTMLTLFLLASIFESINK